jgi:hypothetical protein
MTSWQVVWPLAFARISLAVGGGGGEGEEEGKRAGSQLGRIVGPVSTRAFWHYAAPFSSV